MTCITQQQTIEHCDHEEIPCPECESLETTHDVCKRGGYVHDSLTCHDCGYYKEHDNFNF